YDIKAATIDAIPDEAGIRSSIEQIKAFIAYEIARGIPSEHIFVAGFSQGGAIALELGLRIATPLAGILALSTYLPLAKLAAQEVSPAAKVTPIFMAHGKYDDVVPYSLGDAARTGLARLDCRLTWQEYPMQHSVCAAEVMDIQNWLSKKIATK
ncbi:MAG: alpha/beta hydrolase, partial [Gallionella sp.]